MTAGMSTGWLTRAIDQARVPAASGTLAAQLNTAIPPMSTFKPLGRVVQPGVPGKLAAYPTRVEHARAHRLAAERARRNRRRARKGRPEPGGLQSARTVTWTMTIDTSGIEAAMAGLGAAFRRLGEHMSVVHTRLAEVNLEPLMRLYADGGRISPPRPADDNNVPVVASRGQGAWIPAEVWDRCSASELTSTLLSRTVDTTHYDRDLTDTDVTTSADSLDCSSSSGARWSDLMSRIDELTEET